MVSVTRFRWFGIAAAVACVLVASSSDCLAGGFSNPDFGGRRMGMFAVVARPDDVTAVFHNPAGLTLLDGTQFYHAQSWFFVELGLRLYDSAGFLKPDHEIHPDWSVGLIPFVGLASDLGTKDFRLGFGIYAPNAYGAALPTDEPSRYQATRALFVAGRATVSAAYRLSPKLSLGASVNLIYVYLMGKRVMNPLVLANPDRRFDDPATTTTHESDATLAIDGRAWTWAWDVGLLFTPLETFRIGATFSSGSPIHLKGDVKLTWRDGKVEKSTHSTEMTIPFTLRAGFNWEFAPGFEWGTDVFWWHYQVFQEQRSVLSTPIMGLKEFRDARDNGNSWAWCTGLMYHVRPDLALMFGYQMDFTPSPTRTYSLENTATSQRGISVGTRWDVSKRVRLGLALVRNWFDLIHVQDSLSTPPTNTKGYG